MTKKTYRPALVLDLDGPKVEILRHDAHESGLNTEEKLRFAIGITLWLVGRAEIAWPKDPDDSLWTLLLERQRDGSRHARDWLSDGKWPGATLAWCAVLDAARALHGEAPVYGITPGEMSYSDLLEQDVQIATGQAPRRGRPTMASGNAGTFARGGQRTSGTKLEAATRRGRDHDPYAEPEPRPVPPDQDW